MSSSRERGITCRFPPSSIYTSDRLIITITILNVKRANIVMNRNANLNLATRHLGYFVNVAIGAAALGAALTPRKRGP